MLIPPQHHHHYHAPIHSRHHNGPLHRTRQIGQQGDYEQDASKYPVHADSFPLPDSLEPLFKQLPDNQQQQQPPTTATASPMSVSAGPSPGGARYGTSNASSPTAASPMPTTGGAAQYGTPGSRTAGSQYGSTAGGMKATPGTVLYPYGGKMRYLQWLWGATVWFWSTLAWVIFMPWRATKWLTPGFLQPAVQWVENTALWWGMPPVRLAAGALYGSISFVDNMLSWLTGTTTSTHTSNVHHFRTAYEAYLRLIAHKARLIEQHGIDGLWMAFETKSI